jgi:Flp pilus assembly protein TadG
MRRRGEDGQVLIVVVVTMIALLGMCAFALDLGNWYVNRQKVQAAADAAALAAAAHVPAGGCTNARSAGLAQYAANEQGDTVDVTCIGTDTVRVTGRRDVGTFFAGMFGIDTVRVGASATATVRSFTRVRSGMPVMPWVVMKGSYAPNVSYSIWAQKIATPHNGAAGVPVIEKDCVGNTSNTDDYRDMITGELTPCDLSVGQDVDLNPGNFKTPTEDAVDTRVANAGGWKTLDKIVQFGPDGTANIIDSTSPQLVIVPVVVDSATGTTEWPDGGGTVRVVGFAWFVITSVSGGEVRGTFVRTSSVDDQSSLGGWNDTANTMYAVVLSQ